MNEEENVNGVAPEAEAPVTDSPVADTDVEEASPASEEAVNTDEAADDAGDTVDEEAQ